MDKTSKIKRLRSALAQRTGTLVLGPLFYARFDSLRLDAYVDEMSARLSDATGWDDLADEHKLMLIRSDLGTERIQRDLAEYFPSPEVIVDQVHPFQLKLASLPFRTVVDLSLHNASQAILAKLGQKYRYLSSDSALVSQTDRLPNETDVIKLGGDLWMDATAVGIDEFKTHFQGQTLIGEMLRSELQSGPVFFYGFEPNDPYLIWFFDTFERLSATTFLALRADNKLWLKYWIDRGVSVVSGHDIDTLEASVEDICDRIAPPATQVDIQELIDEAGDSVARNLARIERFRWVERSKTELSELNASEMQMVIESLQTMIKLSQSGLPIPSRPAAYAAEIAVEAGDLPAARQALSIAVHAISNQREADAIALAAVGRTLIRLGDVHRACLYLKSALHTENTEAIHQADDFAWLSRSILQRIDKLKARGHRRAVIELVAGFLKEQAGFIHLAQAESDDPEFQRSVYYINLRLGRLMALASEMAGHSAQVYAQQAVKLLTRAIELAPAKPDGYKAIRALLTDRKYTTTDNKLWMSLVASAPPAVQRRLGGR